jgi:beta-glucosidase
LKDSTGKPGLTAEYFKGAVEGSPVMTRTDPGVDFAWTDGASAELKDNFSVRWTGTLVPAVAGDYQVGFTGTDAFHFWLDGQVIGESYYSDTSKTRIKTMHLEAGHSYAIKIECSQQGASGLAKLVWHEPGDKKDYTEVVKQADLIIAVLGLAGELEGEEMPIKIEGFSGGDRTNINLPAAQEQLLKDLVATGKPVVVVLMNGSALAVNWADQHVPAILEAWYPGEEGGTAVAEALAGDFSPGGRLPLTFYKSVDQLPAFEDYTMKGRTYRYFTGEPLYPFGYGLSYTTFEYSNLAFGKPSLDATDNLAASVDVKNSGKMAGDEVVEVYLTHAGVDGAPIRALAGFHRVHVDAGATEHVEITIPNRQLSIVAPDGTRKIVAGDMQIWVGSGQPVTHAGAKTAGVSGSVKITGEAVLPK